MVNNEAQQPVDFYAVGFEEMVDLDTKNIVSASGENARQVGQGARVEIFLVKCLIFSVVRGVAGDPEQGRCGVQPGDLQPAGGGVSVRVRAQLPRPPRLRGAGGPGQDWAGRGSRQQGHGGHQPHPGRLQPLLPLLALRGWPEPGGRAEQRLQRGSQEDLLQQRGATYSVPSLHITTFLLLQGRTVLSHDYVFWCGDFNYRINMDRDQVIDMVNKKVNVFMPYKKV